MITNVLSDLKESPDILLEKILINMNLEKFVINLVKSEYSL